MSQISVDRVRVGAGSRSEVALKETIVWVEELLYHLVEELLGQAALVHPFLTHKTNHERFLQDKGRHLMRGEAWLQIRTPRC